MLTPTQTRILTLLDDGKPHSRQEIHACLGDDLAQLSAIQKHISLIRVMLRRKGHDVVCELYQGRPHYRHVILLSTGE